MTCTNPRVKAEAGLTFLSALATVSNLALQTPSPPSCSRLRRPSRSTPPSLPSPPSDGPSPLAAPGQPAPSQSLRSFGLKCLNGTGEGFLSGWVEFLTRE